MSDETQLVLNAVAAVLREEHELDLAGDHSVSIPPIVGRITVRLAEASIPGWGAFEQNALTSQG